MAKITQEELVKEFYLNNSNREIQHEEAIDWLSDEYKKRTGEVFRDPDRSIRKLAQSGFLIKIRKGVYKYNRNQFIKIQNFRCFQNLEINGFKRINLIGGKNNSGKTSLLEALLLYFYPVRESIFALKRMRKESSDSVKKSPKDTWNNLFYNQDLDSTVYIKGNFDKAVKQEVCLSVSQAVQSQSFENFENQEDENFKKFLISSSSATLSIEQKLNKEPSVTSSLIANKRGIISSVADSNEIPLVPSSYLISNKEIAELYDKVDYEGKGEEVLSILKILIPSISGLKTYSFIEPTLHIQTPNHSRGLPISLFGDAVYRVAAITLELLNSEHSVLFIDEIENGIHYTCQKDVWLGLFRLAEKLDTLIFATTHSIEMIKAFAEAGQDFPDQGAYFELAYSPRSQNIIAINRDMETLQYDLEHGKAIRGE